MAYGERLQGEGSGRESSASTAQNYVSAVNAVMSLATQGRWESVSPTKDCGIDQRSGITTENRAISEARHDELKAGVGERLGAMLDFQRSLGLRFEESAKINAAGALAEPGKPAASRSRQEPRAAWNVKFRPRPRPFQPLKGLRLSKGKDRSMIPSEQSYASFQAESWPGELREAGGAGFHCERHAFAQDRYEALTGAPAPVVEGWGRDERFERLADALGVSTDEVKAIDQDARQQVAQELGHGRTEVTNAYLG